MSACPRKDWKYYPRNIVTKCTEPLQNDNYVSDGCYYCNSHNKAASDSDKLNERKADHIIYHKSEFSDSILINFSNIMHVMKIILGKFLLYNLLFIYNCIFNVWRSQLHKMNWKKIFRYLFTKYLQNVLFFSSHNCTRTVYYIKYFIIKLVNHNCKPFFFFVLYKHSILELSNWAKWHDFS